MDAMGQMGNSEEATMEDDGEYDGEIDELIDNFDPNDPSTMEFQTGGAVLPNYLGTTPPQQQFSYGFMPPQQQGFQAPGYSAIPSQTPFVTSPARVAVGQAPVVPENRTYVGPDGTEIIIPFYDGKPMKGYVIPKGFKYKSPEEVVAETPEVAQPVVTQPDGGNGADDREREAERQAQMAQDRRINNDLAYYDPEFAELISNDPFMTGKSTMNIAGAVFAGIQTHLGRTVAIERIAEKYNIDLTPYTNTGIKGALSKYDDKKFAEDLGVNTDPKRDEKREAQSQISESDYAGFGMSKEEQRAQYQEDLDEIADAIDRGESKSTRTTAPTSTAQKQAEATQALRDEQEARDRQEESGDRDGGTPGGVDVGDLPGADDWLNKGGLIKQTERALKSSRKK